MAPHLAANVWAPWTNPRIELFHGTIRSSAENIVHNGVDLSRCEENSDFGVGFYTTTGHHQAVKFAKRKSDELQEAAQVVRITLDRETLAALSTIAFLRGTLDAIHFWSFVAHCRLGRDHRPAPGQMYDVGYGPVAMAWRGPRDSRVWEGYDQISFHTEAALILLNDDSVCSLEMI